VGHDLPDELRARTLGDVVAQRLDEWLMRQQRLLVLATVEHERALGMRAQGEVRRQARLAAARSPRSTAIRRLPALACS
jgi:hypothetical protein